MWYLISVFSNSNCIEPTHSSYGLHASPHPFDFLTSTIFSYNYQLRSSFCNFGILKWTRPTPDSSASDLMSILCCFCRSKDSKNLCNIPIILRRRPLGRPGPKLEGTLPPPPQPVGCTRLLLSVFAATLHIWRLPPSCATWWSDMPWWKDNLYSKYHIAVLNSIQFEQWKNVPLRKNTMVSEVTGIHLQNTYSLH
jgi:hypothetical protein